FTSFGSRGSRARSRPWNWSSSDAPDGSSRFAAPWGSGNRWCTSPPRWRNRSVRRGKPLAMAIHDRYARRTAFELLFPDPARATAVAESVHAEASGLGVDARHPHQFLTLGSVGAFLREIRAE